VLLVWRDVITMYLVAMTTDVGAPRCDVTAVAAASFDTSQWLGVELQVIGQLGPAHRQLSRDIVHKQ
jgi:hypothetical protein